MAGGEPLGVRLAWAGVPGVPSLPPSLAAKLARPGLVRGVTLELWDAVRADPGRAGPTLREGLRAHGRSLGSKGRHAAGAALYGMIRLEGLLDALLTEVGRAPDDGLGRLLAWLVLAEGWPPGPGGGDGVDVRVLADGVTRVARRVADLAPEDALAMGASVPLPVARAWWRALGPEAADLVAAFAARPPLAIRVNRSRATVEQVVARLAVDGVEALPGRHATGCLVLPDRVDVHLLPVFQEGWVEVQDEGSQILADLALPDGDVKGLRVVDWCAGAGGKALALADRGARVLALDVRRDALVELERRAGRCGFPIRTALLGPGGAPPPEARGADVVLLDAPCSGSGVLRRHPETRYRLGAERVRDLVRLQGDLLGAAARVAPRVVYGTCSLLPDENEGVIERFCTGTGWRAVRHLGDGGTLWPHRTGTDGFFGVVLEGVRTGT